uniref:Uncharacterized protein n=1 Tax=viral metagenome TaxID=1070528 RepID=A0A6C0HLN7_9ZZZZ
MVLFVHATQNKYAPLILKDQILKSYSKTQKVGYGEENIKMDKNVIFLSVLFNFFKVAIPNDTDKTFFFFDKNIFTNNKSLHYSNYWEWGNFVEQISIKYNNDQTINKNIQTWATSYKIINDVKEKPMKYFYGFMDGVQTEIVFEDTVNFDSLVGIYSTNANFSHPLLITDLTELKTFLNKYKIKDVDTNPENNYNIPHLINWSEQQHTEADNKWLFWAATQNYSSPELKKWKTFFNKSKTQKKKSLRKLGFSITKKIVSAS